MFNKNPIFGPGWVAQVGDAYIAGMAEPYLTDQHSAVRVVEFGLAMIKVIQRNGSWMSDNKRCFNLDGCFWVIVFSFSQFDFVFWAWICQTQLNQRCKLSVQATAKWTERLRQRGESYKDANVRCRVGVHHGECVGGIVGTGMMRYHLFGEFMSIVDILEATSKEGVCQISDSCRKQIESEGGFSNSISFEAPRLDLSCNSDFQLWLLLLRSARMS